WQHANHAIVFTTPGNQQQLGEREPFVEYARLMYVAEREPHPQSVEALNFNMVKVGGAPFWIQQPKRWICSCGAAMDVLCSVLTRTRDSSSESDAEPARASAASSAGRGSQGRGCADVAAPATRPAT